MPARRRCAYAERARSAPSIAPSGPPRPWQRRVRKAAAGSEQADHSTVGARPPQGAAGYAPLLLRGPWAGGGRVLAVLPQEHLLRSPSGEGAGQRIACARLPFLWCPGVHPTQYGIFERLPATSEGGAMWPAPE